MSDRDRQDGRDRHRSRRWVLRAGVVATAGLAGCSDNGGDDQPRDGGEAAPDRETETEAGADTVGGTPDAGESPEETATEAATETETETTAEERGQPQALGDEWPTFQSGPERSGYSPRNTPPSAPVAEAWRQDLSPVARPEAHSQPTLVDGTVYTAFNCSGGADDPRLCLLAVDAVTGEEVWRESTMPATPDGALVSVQTTTAHGGGRVYAETDRGYLVAADAGTGTVQWDRQFQSVSDNLDGTLLYSEGTLYAHAGPTGNTYDEGEGGIRAVDAASGDTLWSFTDLQSFGTLAAVDGTLVAKGDSRATTYGLDPETGEVRWSTDAYPTSRFGCRDGTCYAYGGSAHAFGTDGTQEWGREGVAFSPRAPDEFGPAVANGRAFFPTADEGVVALETASGDELWRSGGGDDTRGRTVGTPVLAGDGETVYTTTDVEVLALDAASGDVEWQYELDASATSDVVVGNGALYLTCRGGESPPRLLALA